MAVRWATVLIAMVLVLAACGGDDAASTTTTDVDSTTTLGESTATTASPGTTAATVTTGATTTTFDSATTTTTDPLAFTIDVAGGQVDGPDRMSVSRGDLVVIVVTADIADEVHLHGYDAFAEVAPGAPAELEIVADIPGIFELELEGSHLLLSELEVR